LLNNKDSNVHFLVGGTQTNTTAISAFLRPHQGVISAESGHVNVHETGAIEATGHKVIVIASNDGKLSAKQVDEAIKAHYEEKSPEHMVQPAMVYISNPTEIGTIYKKKELEELHSVCKKHNLIFYVDGARLGCALASEENDVVLSDLAKLTDAFYIGGTKMGALFGEAVVINNQTLNKDFRYIIKQKGGLLAKGRLLGIQFAELFRDNLYMNLAIHANSMAKKLTEGIKVLNYSFITESTTNQVFPILPNELLEKLNKNYSYTFWEKYDESHSVIRLCTCWATKEEAVDNFLKDLSSYTK
jgi:threonine aldolase